MCHTDSCRQVFITFRTPIKWPVVVVDRWLLFRGSFSNKIVMALLKVVIVDRRLLFGVGR